MSIQSLSSHLDADVKSGEVSWSTKHFWIFTAEQRSSKQLKELETSLKRVKKKNKIKKSKLT